MVVRGGAAIAAAPFDIGNFKEQSASPVEIIAQIHIYFFLIIWSWLSLLGSNSLDAIALGRLVTAIRGMWRRQNPSPITTFTITGSLPRLDQGSLGPKGKLLVHGQVSFYMRHVALGLNPVHPFQCTWIGEGACGPLCPIRSIRYDQIKHSWWLTWNDIQNRRATVYSWQVKPC